MKNLFIGIALLFGSHAFAACPNLAGAYECGFDYSGHTVISQTDDDKNIRTYAFKGDNESFNMVTDGKARPFEDNAIKGDEKTICKGTTITFLRSGYYYNGTVRGAKYDLTENYSLDAKKNLNMVGTTVLHHPSGFVQTIPLKENCPVSAAKN